MSERQNARVADDWRVSVTVTDEAEARRILVALNDRDVHDELRGELGGRVAVSSDGPTVFVYADTRRSAEAARGALATVLEEEDASGSARLDQWHPIEERWEDANVPLPSTEVERQTERARLDADDEATSLATGIAQWEVRVELDSPHAAEALADELERDGRSTIRRAEFLLVGANDRDDAGGGAPAGWRDAAGFTSRRPPGRRGRARPQPKGEAGLLGVAVVPVVRDGPAGLLLRHRRRRQPGAAHHLRRRRLGRAEPILTGIPNGFNHDGGRMVFGPGRILYVSTGETGHPDLAQDRGLAGRQDPADHHRRQAGPGNPVRLPGLDAAATATCRVWPSTTPAGCGPRSSARTRSTSST